MDGTWANGCTAKCIWCFEFYSPLHFFTRYITFNDFNDKDKISIVNYCQMKTNTNAATFYLLAK